jgi:hypothetical protein
MVKIILNGSNRGFASIPAGFASKAVLAADVTCSASVAAADIIEITGALAPVNFNVPLNNLLPQIIGDDIPAPTFPPAAPTYAPLQIASWLKVFYNNTAGLSAVTVRGVNLSLSPLVYGAGVAVPAGTRQMLYSPDGVNVYAAAASV